MIETGYRVSYNGLSPWGTGAGCFPPFVSVNIEESWGADYIGSNRSVTLNGTIPSGQISNTISAITGAFASNFKEFSAPNIYMPVAFIEQISFGEQKYIGKVDYSITLRDFSGFISNVAEPVDEVEMSESKDGSVTISHKVSARGVQTTSTYDAFDNAKNFVLGRTGLANSLFANAFYVVSQSNTGNALLLSQQESINRVNGTYGITETFLYDPLRNTTNNIFKRFSAEITSGIADDYIQVSVNGSYKIGQNGNINDLKSSISMPELYTQATGIFHTTGLNAEPVSFSVELNETGRELSVKAAFDNSPYGSFFDYEIEGQKIYWKTLFKSMSRAQLLAAEGI